MSKLIPKGAEGNLWKRTRADVKNQARTALHAALPNADESRQSCFVADSSGEQHTTTSLPQMRCKKMEKTSLVLFAIDSRSMESETACSRN